MFLLISMVYLELLNLPLVGAHAARHNHENKMYFTWDFFLFIYIFTEVLTFWLLVL